MRSALLLLCACSASNADPKPALPHADVTFRWAATPIDCQHSLEGRSNTSKCYGNDANKTFIVVGYAPTGPSDPHIQVMRYEGVTAAALQRWTQTLDLGAHPGEPIVAVREGVTVVAAISDGAVNLATLSTKDGKAGAPRRIVERDAARVQVVAGDKSIQLHVLMRDGSGRVVVLDLAGTPTAMRDVPAKMLRVKMSPAATSADGEASVTVGGTKLAAAWDGDALVVKHPKWMAKLVENDRFRMQALTLHATTDRVIATLHHGAGSGAIAIALDAKTGNVAWKRGVTGIGPVVHSVYYNRVSSLLDGDLLAVQGWEAGGTYVCTLSIADGIEHACVDHLPVNVTIDPGPIKHAPKALPAQPIGPQTKGPTCTRLGTPNIGLTVKRLDPKTISGVINTPSATCKPRLGGGIAGDRIELEVWDGGDKPGLAACTCSFMFTQEVRPESKTVIARVRGGAQIGQIPLPP